VLKQRIQDVTENRSVFGDGRPNCLIIDEIDGAMGGAQGKGAINALVAIIQAGDKQVRGRVRV
jgi:chromosome transmission fidelity protein 18